VRRNPDDRWQAVENRGHRGTSGEQSFVNGREFEIIDGKVDSRKEPGLNGKIRLKVVQSLLSESQNLYSVA
jgi:hypothetical protein